MSRVTRHVVLTAVRDPDGWRGREGGDLSVSVDLSTSCLTDPALPQLLAEVIVTGTDPGKVVLEVTETTLVHDPDAALSTCCEVRELGFGLSIDDDGTGCASLAHLSDLPATELKIDRSFTSRLPTDHRVRVIIAGTVELGHQLGLRVVAEGAEDVATAEALAHLGCDDSRVTCTQTPSGTEVLTLAGAAHRGAPRRTSRGRLTQRAPGPPAQP